MQLHERMQGQNVALKNREEWCIISETLFHSTNYSEAFTENVHILCHLQVAIWKAALLESPPEIDSTKYGWENWVHDLLSVRVRKPVKIL